MWQEVAAVGLVLLGVAAILREAVHMHRERLADEDRDMALEAAELTLWTEDIEYAEQQRQWVREQMKGKIRERV